MIILLSFALLGLCVLVLLINDEVQKHRREIYYLKGVVQSLVDTNLRRGE